MTPSLHHPCTNLKMRTGGLPSANDTTVPLAEPEAMIEKDWPVTQGARPARLEDPFAPTATLVDKLASPLTLANSMLSKGQEYPKWVKVHSSQKAATVGSYPTNLGNPSSTTTVVPSGIKEPNTS